MKNKFCNIHINVTKYDVSFNTKGGGVVTPPTPRGYVTAVISLEIRDRELIVNSLARIFREFILQPTRSDVKIGSERTQCTWK